MDRTPEGDVFVSRKQTSSIGRNRIGQSPGTATNVEYAVAMKLIENEWVTVALKFQTDDKIPVVRARGDGWIGTRIREFATAKNIPVVECNPVVVQDIFENLRAYKAVPEKHFAAIASACQGVLQDKELAFDYVKNEFTAQQTTFGHVRFRWIVRRLFV